MPQTPPETMRVIEITKPGAPEVLRLTRRPVPVLTESAALIEVAAAGVNRPDILQRKGLYPPPPGASDIPGLEVAGTVIAVGDKARAVKAGDKVTALVPGGGYAEYALADEGSCLPVPRGLSFEEAAAIPETYFTVWTNVFEEGGLTGGETLFLHGGASGIGTAAIAMAKALGAKVIATASSEAKLEAIRALGADYAFNYCDDEWEEEVKKLGGADVVLDMAGGDFVVRNLEALNPGGRHVSIATLRGATAEINLAQIMRKRLRLTGSTLRGRDNGEKARIAFALRQNIWPLIESGRIKPTIDSVFPLEEAVKAHERMEQGRHVGKIILKPS
ncbi:MAG TPA: NAD(P)H-quinone oxidoreductase [Parvularculaceae bacterium]|nr:NAD(P)H-quinone oxidoreductase [Parvularculaceae bacterium]